jgi:hypothetical protein
MSALGCLLLALSFAMESLRQNVPLIAELGDDVMTLAALPRYLNFTALGTSINHPLR